MYVYMLPSKNSSQEDRDAALELIDEIYGVEKSESFPTGGYQIWTREYIPYPDDKSLGARYIREE